MIVSIYCIFIAQIYNPARTLGVPSVNVKPLENVAQEIASIQYLQMGLGITNILPLPITSQTEHSWIFVPYI